jgi:hypothetical protein
VVEESGAAADEECEDWQVSAHLLLRAYMKNRVKIRDEGKGC